MLVMTPCIRRLREKKGWSVYRLAQESGVSRAFIKKIEEENGDNPSLFTLAKLLSALEVEEAILTYENGTYRMTLKESQQALSHPPVRQSGRKQRKTEKK